MPQIPTFQSQQPYGNPAVGGAIPISVAAEAGRALAEGLDRVSAQFAQVAAHQRQQEAALEAAKIDGEIAMQTADMMQRYQKDPNPADAPQRFRDELTGLHKTTMAGITNPLVRQRVEMNFAQRGPVAYTHVLTAAARNQDQATREGIAGRSSIAAKSLATAADDASLELAAGDIDRAWGIGEAVSAFTPEQRRMGRSKDYADAILLAAQTDPERAARLARRFGDRMDVTHLGQVERALRGPLEHRQEATMAMQALGITGGVSPNDPEGRARYLYDRARERGYSEAAAAGIVANARHESANFDPRTSHDSGTGVGILGWRGDRRKALEGRFGTASTFEQQAQFLLDELDPTGPEAASGARLRETGLTAQQAGADYSSMGVRPRDVEGNRRARGATAENYLRQFSGDSAQPAPAERALPDIDEAMKKLEAEPAYQALPDERKMRVQSRVREEWNLQYSRLGQQRAQLADELKDLTVRLELGRPEEIPEAAIRRMFPPLVAERQIEDLRAAKTAGGILAPIAYGTPAQIAEARAKLAAPDGPMGGQTAYQQNVLAKFDHIAAKRAAALHADSALYAASSPAMRELAARVDLNTPEGAQAFVGGLLAEQSRMGVLAPQILSNQQVAQRSQEMQTGPEKGNMVETLGGMAKAYGQYWPRVFGELVRRGKVDDGYKILAQMTESAQVPYASDYQQVLKILSDPNGKGRTALNAAARTEDPAAQKVVGDAVGVAMQDFTRAVGHLPNGIENASSVGRAVHDLALFYMGRDGTSASSAVTKAYKGIIGERWAVDGTMLYPKAQEAQVLTSTRAVQQGLTAETIAEPPASAGTPGMKPEDRRIAWLQAAKRGEWVPSSDSGGLTLAVKVNTGAFIPVRGVDGAPIQVRFDALPAASPSRGVGQFIGDVLRFGAGP